MHHIHVTACLNLLGNAVQVVIGNQLSVEQRQRARVLHECARLVLDVRQVDLQRRLEVDEVDAACERDGDGNERMGQREREREREKERMRQGDRERVCVRDGNERRWGREWRSADKNGRCEEGSGRKYRHDDEQDVGFVLFTTA